jgi:hypothetical protein
LRIAKRCEFQSHGAFGGGDFFLWNTVPPEEVRRLRFDAEAVFLHAPVQPREIDEQAQRGLVMFAATVEMRI